MTMVPAHTLSKPPHHNFFYAVPGYTDVMTRLGDGCGYAYINNNTTSSSNCEANNHINNNNNLLLGSDLGIGSDHHHNNTSTSNIIIMNDNQEEQYSRISNSTSTTVNEGAASSSSNKHTPPPPNTPSFSHHHHHHDQESSWLQLGLGDTLSKTPHPHDQSQAESVVQTGGGGGGGGLMLELNLGGGRGGVGTGIIGPGFLQQTTSLAAEFRVPQRQTADFGANFFGNTTSAAGCSSGSAGVISHHPPSHAPIPFVVPYGMPYTPQMHPYQHQSSIDQIGWGLFNVMNHHKTNSPFLAAAAGSSTSISPSSSSTASLLPSGHGGAFLTRPFNASGSSSVDSELRVIHPPPKRPHSGLWFMLHASIHQAREPCLPQISKSFLRIKDGRMTVRVAMKYVAKKLGLDSESEVEIRCKGEVLVPLLTLQHVRDQIWSARDDAVTLLPDSSTSDHVMLLHYGRSSTSSF